MLCFPTLPISASALPCEIGNPEDSALVHCAGNTLQLLHLSHFVCPERCPQQPRAEHIDYKIWGVIQQREYESWVNKSDEIKQLVEFRQCTNTAFGWKMLFSCFPVLPGSAEAQVIWGGKVKYFWILIALSVTFLPKISISIHMWQSYSKPKLGRFWDTV